MKPNHLPNVWRKPTHLARPLQKCWNSSTGSYPAKKNKRRLEAAGFRPSKRVGIAMVIFMLVVFFSGLNTVFAQSTDIAPKTEAQPTDPAGTGKRANWTLSMAHTVIRMHNPQYNGGGQFQIRNGRVLAAALSGTNIVNLTPLAQMNLVALDLRGLKIADIKALEGLPLKELFLEDTAIADLAPLAGMQLVRLYLNNTPVRDLGPLKEMPIKTLNLFGTQVTDLTPLNQMPLHFLWLNETPVVDIAPLSRCPLVSLTLHKTRVANLQPLSKSRLERLHIGETPVTDLIPLANVPLKRLIFSPGKITKGIDIIRKKASIREIGTSFENRMSPELFWKRYDQGQIN